MERSVIMGKIFSIMGKSSTGKDTIYKQLLAREDLALRRIVTYTTRPIREGEIEGEEYHFCNMSQEEEILCAGKMIEQRSYQTCHGRWDYFTVDDGAIQLQQEDYLMIATLEAYEKIKDYYESEKIVPIYIEVEDGIRLRRALEREIAQKEPKYEEMCRRFLADAQDFSEERLRQAGVTIRFENHNLAKTTEEIAAYIRQNC